MLIRNVRIALSSFTAANGDWSEEMRVFETARTICVPGSRHTGLPRGILVEMESARPPATGPAGDLSGDIDIARGRVRVRSASNGSRDPRKRR